MRMVYIYVLEDDQSGEPRYVGQTVCPRERMAGHRKGRGDSPVSRWMRKLGRETRGARMVIVDCAVTPSYATALEAEWIRYGRRLGWRLLNVLDSGRTYTEEFALRASRRATGRSSFGGRKHRPESIEKIRQAALRQELRRVGPHLERTRAKMRATARSASPDGKAFSLEHRAAISAAKVGHEVSPETRAKISASLRARAR